MRESGAQIACRWGWGGDFCICNTISTYHKEPLQSTMPQSSPNEDAATAVSGAYKDDDSKYSLKNLLKRQETEAGNEE